MAALIVAGGELHAGPAVDALVRARWDMIACADGGTRQVERLGLRPDVVIGDLDSASEVALERLRRAGARVISYPAEKDKTDLDLAVEYAVAAGIRDIVALAALGGRVDHALANIMLTVKAQSLGASLVLTDGASVARLITAEAEIVGAPGDWVSLVAVGGAVRGVSTEGLKYPLRGADLGLGETLGVSNELTGQRARVKVEAGQLIAIHTARAAT